MFSERLKELRAESNLKQEELANIIGISRNAISKYESAGQEPSFDILIKLADCFNVSLDYLLCRTDIKTPCYVLNELKSNSETKYFDNIIHIIKNNLKSLSYISSLLKLMEDNKKL